MLSGSSTVRFFSFNGKKLECLYDDYDTDKIYRVEVETPIVYSEVSGGEGCVHMRFDEPSEKLIVEPNSGLYSMPSGFSNQMAIINKGHHILAGLNAKEYSRIFVLEGNGTIALCPVTGESSVSISKA